MGPTTHYVFVHLPGSWHQSAQVGPGVDQLFAGPILLTLTLLLMGFGLAYLLKKKRPLRVD
jgi:hypothetical protein